MFLSAVYYCVVCVLVASIEAHPTYGVTVGLRPYSHPVQSLYHAQDVLGNYVYGYATPTSTKSEAKTADGITRGGYSYIDSNGIIQTVNYVADAVHGFRVAATNLPQDLPEVAYAKFKHLVDYDAIKADHASIGAERAAAVHAQVVPAPIPVPVQDLPEVVRAREEHLAAVEATKVRDAIAYNAALAANVGAVPQEISGSVVPIHTSVATAPFIPYAKGTAIAYTPVLYGPPTSSQYHSQDGLGHYSYGYVGPLSSKSETKTADGITRGGYSYIDANGIIQTVHYISDPVNGFRVAATNLPADTGSVKALGDVQPHFYTQHITY